MDTAATLVISNLMAPLRVLNTASPSLPEVFRVYMSKLLFRLAKVVISFTL